MKKENYTPKINKRNKAFKEKIIALSSEHTIIGILDVEGLPAMQFQRIRGSLNKTAKVLIVKKNIIDLCLDELETKFSGIKKLMEKANGVVGLIFTNDNPFKLYKTIKKNKSSAPAKAGQIAPNKIIVPQGPTSFAPGPIIGELGALKIKAGINAGKVEIKEDSLVAEEGDEISSNLAGVLTRLGIEPMEVGLNIKSVYENGFIFTKDDLDIDQDAFENDLKSVISNAYFLSLGLGYTTKENIEQLISQSYKNSISLALGLDLEEAKDIKEQIQNAPKTTASQNSEVKEDKKEEKKEEPEVDASAGLGDLF